MAMAKMQRHVQDVTAPAAAAAAAAAAPVIDNTHLPKPILMRCDEEGSITVKISGFPDPVTRWQIGRKRVKESSKYRLKTEGSNHTLVISRVTNDLEQGVWVIANNQYGEDCCLLEVKMLSNNVDRIEATPGDGAPHVKPIRKKKPRSSSSHDTHSIMSLDTWQAEMEQRNRMRSVDDVMNASLEIRSTFSGSLSRDPERGRPTHRLDQNGGSLRDKRYNSTEAVHNELQTTSIPPLSMDEHSYASASSIPGTPYEERKMPEFSNSEPQKASRVKKSRRSRSAASLTDRSKDSDDKPPRPKTTKMPKNAATDLSGKVEDADKLKPPKPPSSFRAVKDANQSEDGGDGSKPKKKKLRKRTTSKNSILSASSLDRSIDDYDSGKPSTDSTPPESASQTALVDESSVEKPPPVALDVEDQCSDADNLKSFTDDNNNDIWELFGMKLDVLCHYLLIGKIGKPTVDKINDDLIENQIDAGDYVDLQNTSKENSLEECERKKNDVFETVDDGEEQKKLANVVADVGDSHDEVQFIVDDENRQMKPPSGKKKQKRSKSSDKENNEMEKGGREHAAKNGTDAQSETSSHRGKVGEDKGAKTEDTENEEKQIRIVIIPPKKSSTKTHDQPKEKEKIKEKENEDENENEKKKEEKQEQEREKDKAHNQQKEKETGMEKEQKQEQEKTNNQQKEKGKTRNQQKEKEKEKERKKKKVPTATLR